VRNIAKHENKRSTKKQCYLSFSFMSGIVAFSESSRSKSFEINVSCCYFPEMCLNFNEIVVSIVATC